MTKLRKKCLSNLFSSKLDHLKKKFTTIMKRSRLNDRNPTQLILSIFLFWERRFSSNKKLTLKHFFGGKKIKSFQRRQRDLFCHQLRRRETPPFAKLEKSFWNNFKRLGTTISTSSLCYRTLAKLNPSLA